MTRVVVRVDPCPRRVAILGGGRWARVLAGVVADITPETTRLTLHSPHNAAAMRDFARSLPRGRRVDVSESWPEFDLAEPSAAIVANAARDHERAIEWLLDQRVSTLVEKPMASRSEFLVRAADVAAERGVKLAPAHIFLFHPALAELSAQIRSLGAISSVELWWTDPAAEQRHGEAKQYDSALTIVADWMPHVVSVLAAVLGELPSRATLRALERGGARAELELAAGRTACVVHLERESDTRRRVIEVRGANGRVRLDFGQHAASATAALPSELMLESFLIWAARAPAEPAEPRLVMSPAIRACELAESVERDYCAAQSAGLVAALRPGSADRRPGGDVAYAVREILAAGPGEPGMPLEAAVERLRHMFTGADADTIAVELVRHTATRGDLAAAVDALLS